MNENLDTNLSCPICLDDLESQDFVQPCSICIDTYIHKKCFNKMIDYNLETCPVCRTPYYSNNYIVINIESIADNFNFEQNDYGNNFYYFKLLLTIINIILLIITSLFFLGVIGGVMFVTNKKYITFNPFNSFFILQIIFGSFIVSSIVSIFYYCNLR